MNLELGNNNAIIIVINTFIFASRTFDVIMWHY